MTKMTTINCTSADRKDLEKFTGQLVYKIVQVIVQSRLGEKIKTQSKPHASSSDLFNLIIKDMPDVNSVTRQALSGKIPSIGVSICVEISIQTSEGDTMIVENWLMEMTDQVTESDNVDTSAIHNRMTVILKSLIIAARTVPAYKLSALQSSGSFVLMYHVYLGEPNCSSFGDKCKRLFVGRVGMPIGALSLSLVYRTEFAITPQKSNKGAVFMVKSDHFNPDMSPKCFIRPVGSNHFLNAVDQESVVEELADACAECNDDANKFPNGNGHFKVNAKITNTAPILNNGRICPVALAEEQINLSECMKVGAFANNKKAKRNGDYIVPEPAFASLLKTMPLAKRSTIHTNNNSPVKEQNGNIDLKVEKNAPTNNEFKKSRTMVTSCVDDFVMVDLKPPFACSDEGDLSVFFKDCQAAPQLLCFNEQPSFADQVNELGLQLAKFETNVPDLDDFVDSLCSDEISK